MKTLVIPESVTSIGRGVFSKCQALKSVTIPNSVTSIGNGAFNGCTQLPSLVIPSSVTYIGDRIVTYCNNLTNLQVEQGNPVYDSRDNCNAIIETASNTLVDGCGSTMIPNTVTGIGFGAFEMCKALKSLIIPNSVTHIDGWVFHCSNLESVEIPNSVTSIGHDAFAWCYGLKCVEIPGYADSVGTGVFNYCDALTRVICRSVFPPSVSFGFEGNTSITLFVPIAGLELYKSDPIWGLVPHIEPFLGAGPGDINGDGQFGISDVTGMIDLLLNGGKLPAYADVNGDGKVSITDVTALIDMLLNGN